MHTVSKRRCFGLEPMMDEDTMPASAAVSAPQRGRRRSPAPVPPPHARHDPSAMLFSLALAGAHPTSAPASAQVPHRRQQTPSGGNGTFRGRRRYRSPSLSVSSSSAAIRKAPSRSNSLLQSKSLSKSVSKSKSRPTSPLSPGASSRGRAARGDSPSPRRVIFRATVDMEHGYPYFHSHHYQHHQHHQHHHAHLQPFSVKKARRAHCPSRPGSVDGSETRRRARTRSRPRYTKDAVSEVAALEIQRSHPHSSAIPLHPTRPTGHASQNSHISMSDGTSDVAVGVSNSTTSITPGHTQCHMPIIDTSGTSDGDAMDIEH